MALGNVHLTPQLVQAVRDAADNVAIASEHTRLRRAGRRYTGLCPLHKEKTPSFGVDPVQGLFYCFGCGRGGDAIKLHMLTSGDDFPAAIESLAHRFGIPLPAAPRHKGGRDEGPDIAAALEAAAEFFRDQLRQASEPRAYLARREISPDLVARFGLGYAPAGWRALVSALHPRLSLAALEAAGLAVRSEKADGGHYDRFRHRLMFPIRNPSGRLVGFGGRTLGDDAAKYLNTSETDQFHKGRLLYGLDLARGAIRAGGRALLVEGYFDVLGAVAAGVEGAVASMGTALTPEQAHLLARYTEEVVVGYDGDDAGERAFRRAVPLLLVEGLAIRRARFGEGNDPDSLRLAQGEQAVRDAVEAAEDAIEIEMRRAAPPPVRGEPRQRAKAAQVIVELLRPIPDGVLRYGYVQRAAERLGVPIEVLWRRLSGGRAPAAPAPAPAAPGPRLVRSLEERILQLLLAEDRQLDGLPELPPEEAFLEPACRSIYRAFRSLYTDGAAGGPPSARHVLARLAAEGEAVDQMARLLLEEPAAPQPTELAESLHRLTRRWHEQVSRELSARIGEAQRAGDRERLDELVREKISLSLALHRGRQEDPS